MFVILNIKAIFVYNNGHLLKMATKKQIVFPKYDKVLEQMGGNIKKRRKLTMIQVAERADISRSTLYLIELGKASVALGAYFNVLRVLGLQNDFLKLAADDELGRKLQDLELLK
jgi:DNA-binding XRE family transcriptional regulator